MTGTPHNGETLSYALKGNVATSGLFVIDSATGQIRVAQDAKLDREAGSSYTGQVEYEVDGRTAAIGLTIEVTDLSAPAAPDAPAVTQTEAADTDTKTMLDVDWEAPEDTGGRDISVNIPDPTPEPTPQPTQAPTAPTPGPAAPLPGPTLEPVPALPPTPGVSLEPNSSVSSVSSPVSRLGLPTADNLALDLNRAPARSSASEPSAEAETETPAWLSLIAPSLRPWVLVAMAQLSLDFHQALAGLLALAFLAGRRRRKRKEAEAMYGSGTLPCGNPLPPHPSAPASPLGS